MKNSNNYILIIIGLILSSCTSNYPQNFTVFGKYTNTSDKTTVHYVEVKSDSTYIHYYKRANAPALINSGTCVIDQFDLPKTNNINIIFSNWKTFDVLLTDTQNYSSKEIIKGGIVRPNGVLLFHPDLDEFNFKKQE